MSKSKIDWCDYVYNPVYGCLNECEYCYARKFAKRFYRQVAEKEIKFHRENYSNKISSKDCIAGIKDFRPTWIESNYQKNFPQKRSRIFVNSMSDIYYWKDFWMLRVLQRIEKYSQHHFLFLTKQPLVYSYFEFPDNCWLGATATTEEEVCERQIVLSKIVNNTFLSVEPILEPINADVIDFNLFNWLILGRETGNRKNRIIPLRKWIEDIAMCAIQYACPVFMKDNLKNIWKEELIKQYPGDFCEYSVYL